LPRREGMNHLRGQPLAPFNFHLIHQPLRLHRF
jgi:hypothetical protein